MSRWAAFAEKRGRLLSICKGGGGGEMGSTGIANISQIFSLSLPYFLNFKILLPSNFLKFFRTMPHSIYTLPTFWKDFHSKI